MEPLPSGEKHSKRCCTSSVSSPSRSRSRSRDRYSRKRRNRSEYRHRSYERRHRQSRSLAPSRSCRRSYERSPSTQRRTRYHGTRENPNRSRVVGVFGLHSTTNEHTLLDVFSAFGPIERISIIHDANTGNSRGFGFIYYGRIEEATRAREQCNGMTLDGKRIRVDYSITQRAHTPTPGVYMGSPSERDSRRQHSPGSHRSRDRSSRDRSSRRRYSDHKSSRRSSSRSR